MAAVAEVDRLLEENAPAGTPDYDRLELLAVLIEAYDDQHYPVARTTPQKIVDFMLGQKEMTRAELAPVLGGRSRCRSSLRRSAGSRSPRSRRFGTFWISRPIFLSVSPLAEGKEAPSHHTEGPSAGGPSIRCDAAVIRELEMRRTSRRSYAPARRAERRRGARWRRRGSPAVEDIVERCGIVEIDSGEGTPGAGHRQLDAR